MFWTTNLPILLSPNDEQFNRISQPAEKPNGNGTVVGDLPLPSAHDLLQIAELRASIEEETGIAMKLRKMMKREISSVGKWNHSRKPNRVITFLQAQTKRFMSFATAIN
ncbi:hypothetical protein TIFTF001_011598 [Ficus carica]|uniref:Uncharacterized protein n=1 Tax=Ficus carica TaxID=3494 RepID=A0AA88AAR0_FICCA|nr:hypothetical protein TIFTF001_011598 [Ficus carica]